MTLRTRKYVAPAITSTAARSSPWNAIQPTTDSASNFARLNPHRFIEYSGPEPVGEVKVNQPQLSGNVIRAASTQPQKIS